MRKRSLDKPLKYVKISSIFGTGTGNDAENATSRLLDAELQITPGSDQQDWIDRWLGQATRPFAQIEHQTALGATRSTTIDLFLTYEEIEQ